MENVYNNISAQAANELSLMFMSRADNYRIMYPTDLARLQEGYNYLRHLGRELGIPEERIEFMLKEY